MAKRRVVITGAAGYVGQRMFKELSERWDLVPIDVIAATRSGEKVPGLVVADLTNPDRNQYRQHFRGADAVIHLGYVRAPGMDATTWQENNDAKFWAEHQNVALAYNVYRVALEEGVRRVVVASSNHAADYYERLVWDGRVDMVTPEMPPRSDNWYGWAKAAYELLGFVFATGKVDGRKLEVVQWRIGGPRDDDIEHVKPGDIKVDAPGARRVPLARAIRCQQAIRMVETDGHHGRARRAVPDRLRDQRQHAPVLEPGQRQDEDRLRAPGRQPGELRRRASPPSRAEPRRRDGRRGQRVRSRREFIGFAIAGRAGGAPCRSGRRRARSSRIGVLLAVRRQSDGPAPSFHVFRDTLRELGHVEGANVSFEYRWAGGKYDRLPALAAELAQSKVDVILSAWSTPSALAAKRATATHPGGLRRRRATRSGSSWSRASRGPGGNVTGSTFLSEETVGKLLQLLKEVVPAGDAASRSCPIRPIPCTSRC